MKRLFPIIVLFQMFVLLPFCILGQCAYKGGKIDFLPQILCKSDYKATQGKPLSSKYGNVASVKVVYDIKKKQLYFLESVKYHLHYDFCSDYLHAYQSLASFNNMEYSDFLNRRFTLSNLNHYEGADIYTLEFFADDKINTNLIIETYNQIKEHTFFGKKIHVLINSPEIEKKAKNFPASIHTISVDKLFASQVYQQMNPSKSYGYLRKVPAKSFSDYIFGKHDIILTDGLPNEFPICEGIMTTCFQTPLCHVNVLSSNRGTPNCAYKNAWENTNIHQLIGKLVYFSVERDTFILQLADSAKAYAFWEKREKNKIMKEVKRDVSVTKLVDMSQITAKDVAIVGGKAANFGELSKVEFIQNTPIPVPEGAFAIPIFFYEQHIRKFGIQKMIVDLLNNKSLQNDSEQLAKALKKIRDSIKNAPINPFLVKSVEEKMKQNNLPYTNYRFRSSTNAEDIPGFNGAGLYTSKTGIIGDTNKSVEKAIKSVWASTWNLRAFQERDYFRIDQENVGMGILVHRAFGDDGANGVAITANLYRKNYPSYTINVQAGETSVVLPESDTILCDQFLIHLSSIANGEDKTTVEFITKSNINGGKSVLSSTEIQELEQYLTAVKKHFYEQYLQDIDFDTFPCKYENFALDIEFKFEKDTRKLYIKQVRRYRE